MMTTAERALKALVAAARVSAPDAIFDDSGYALRLEDNLIETVQLSSFDGEFQAGAGRELHVKMRAAYSSSALVVNTFAPWRRDLNLLTIQCKREFTRLSFERRYPTGLGGTPPHLDVVAEGSTVLAIESKCLEYLHSKPAHFSPAYDRISDSRRDSSWFKLLTELRLDPRRFNYVDAGQLIKHFLGLSLCYANRDVRLLYLFWEPLNSAAFEEFSSHRRELQRLRNFVARNSSIGFEYMSYAELWREWKSIPCPEWLRRHAAAWEERYALTI